MIDLLKKDLGIGDTIKLYLTTGKEPIGKILEFGGNHILLKNEDGNIARIFEVLIGGWDVIQKDENLIKVQGFHVLDNNISDPENNHTKEEPILGITKEQNDIKWVKKMKSSKIQRIILMKI